MYGIYWANQVWLNFYTQTSTLVAFTALLYQRQRQNLRMIIEIYILSLEGEGTAWHILRVLDVIIVGTETYIGLFLLVACYMNNLIIYVAVQL